MTINEYKDALNKGLRKATIASEFRRVNWSVLERYFEHVQDEDGSYKYDDDYSAVLDFTKPRDSWATEEGDGELAKDLYETVLATIEKWMMKLEK